MATTATTTTTTADWMTWPDGTELLCLIFRDMLCSVCAINKKLPIAKEHMHKL